MLYLKEIYYRLLYLVFAFLVCLGYLYFYKEEVVFFIILPSWLSNFPIDYLIFTEPKEIFIFYMTSFLFISGVYTCPFGIYLVYDYLRPALYTIEQVLYKRLNCYFSLVYLFVNLVIFFLVVPFFWNFFASFENQSNLIVFYLELSARNYFNFLVSLFIGSNVLIIIFLILLKIFLSNGLLLLFELKKYLILIFLIFSTVITPPELELQILIFVFLWALLEVVVLVNLMALLYKRKKTQVNDMRVKMVTN